MDLRQLLEEYKHKWKHRKNKYPPKSLREQRMTIEVFGFGLENYKLVKGQYIRKKGV